MTNLTTCLICGGNDSHDLFNCQDHTATKETFQIRVCKNCGFQFTSPQPSEKEIAKYYQSENYISHTGSRRNIFEILYHFARNYSLRKKRKLIAKNSTGKKVLDYGCGTGEFLFEMKKNGWAISGIEPSAIAHAKAESITNSKILKEISDLKEGTSFDIITLWHVLEHLHNPNEILTKLNKHLVKTGTIIIAVPNHQSYDAQHYQSYWAAYDVPRHLWHFSKKDLKAILEKNGFNLTKILPMKLDAYYVSLLSESYKPQKNWKLFKPVRAIVNGLISNIKGIQNTNYSSIIYIAKK